MSDICHICLVKFKFQLSSPKKAIVWNDYRGQWATVLQRSIAVEGTFGFHAGGAEVYFAAVAPTYFAMQEAV